MTLTGALGTLVLGGLAWAGGRDATNDNHGTTQQVAQAEQAPPPAPTPQERVATLKQWLQASQTQLRAYEWIETTVIAKGGEEKSRKQNKCYYGADGALQKIAVASEQGGEKKKTPRGLRGKIAKNKQEKTSEYMQAAVALVHSYVPPDPARLQRSVDTGKFSANPVVPGRRARLDFRDYHKSGDLVSIDVELPTNRLLGTHVSSYLDTTEDAVQLDVVMDVLPDGTIYTAKSILKAKAKDLTVTVDNSGYRRTRSKA